MKNQPPVMVTDSTGRQGIVALDPAAPMSSNAQVLIRCEGMPPVFVPRGMLILRPDGHYDLPVSLAELAPHPSPAEPQQTLVIPVVADELQIGKRQVETGKVRVTKRVHEQQEWVDIPLFQEVIEIKRVPVNRLVDSPVAVREAGDVLIVPVLEEMLVVQKQLWLKEEVHIITKRSERRHAEQVTLRREEVLITPPAEHVAP